MSRGAPKGRAGTTGTSMQIVKRPKQVGPRLKLPKQPDKAKFFPRKAIQAMADEKRAEGKEEVARDFEAMKSWEDALSDWKVSCARVRASYEERRRAYETHRKADARENKEKKRAEIAFMQGRGIPLPQSRR